MAEGEWTQMFQMGTFVQTALKTQFAKKQGGIAQDEMTAATGIFSNPPSTVPLCRALQKFVVFIFLGITNIVQTNNAIITGSEVQFSMVLFYVKRKSVCMLMEKLLPGKKYRGG